MLEVVTSANVACGFHAGDPSTLRAVCAAAVANGVAIGAQVAYPDLVGFGRRALDIDPVDLRDVVLYQLGALDAFAQVAGGEVAYVKPHGALYHATVHDPGQAEAVVAAAAEYDPSLVVLGAPGSACCVPPRRPASNRSSRRSPTVPTCATGGWCRARSRTRSSSIAAEVADAGGAPGDGARRDVRRRHSDRRRRAFAVRARRHARSGRAGQRRARRAGSRRRRRPSRSRVSSPVVDPRRCCPYGPSRSSSPISTTPMACSRALRRAAAAWTVVDEVVPAAAHRARAAAPGAVREQVAHVARARGDPGDEPTAAGWAVEIPCDYDGDDLDAVAEPPG